VKRLISAAVLLGAAAHATAQTGSQGDDTRLLRKQLEQLKAQVQALEAQLVQLEAEEKGAEPEEPEAALQLETTETAEDGIRLGGAVRSNISHTSYNDGNRNRGGDWALDTLRLNFDGSISGIDLSAEIRHYDYMNVVKYAYLGYQFNERWRSEAGIVPVPFGNSPYNSHNFFFSPNYYIGLEDDHDLGVLFRRSRTDDWQLDLGFLKNDELGGVDGYVADRSNRYSYDVVGVRALQEGIYESPQMALGEYNTAVARYAYFLGEGDIQTEIGVSGMRGGLHDGLKRAGNYQAWAFHLNSDYQRWNLQFQHSEYRYDVDGYDRMAVGAYAFYDSIAAEASSSTINLAYSLPVDWGPISTLQFYNDYGRVYNKSDGSRDTEMNVTGVSVSAGGLFTYFDLVHARNQPFIGGSMAGDSDEIERRFNINIGYYF
jgi:hypothetical protein